MYCDSAPFSPCFDRACACVHVDRYNDLAKSETRILMIMQDTLATMNKGFFDPNRGGGDSSVPVKAAEGYGGFWGPFLP